MITKSYIDLKFERGRINEPIVANIKPLEGLQLPISNINKECCLGLSSKQMKNTKELAKSLVHCYSKIDTFRFSNFETSRNLKVYSDCLVNIISTLLDSICFRKLSVKSFEDSLDQMCSIVEKAKENIEYMIQTKQLPSLHYSSPVRGSAFLLRKGRIESEMKQNGEQSLKMIFGYSFKSVVYKYCYDRMILFRMPEFQRGSTSYKSHMSVLIGIVDYMQEYISFSEFNSKKKTGISTDGYFIPAAILVNRLIETLGWIVESEGFADSICSEEQEHEFKCILRDILRDVSFQMSAVKLLNNHKTEEFTTLKAPYIKDLKKAFDMGVDESFFKETDDILIECPKQVLLPYLQPKVLQEIYSKDTTLSASDVSTRVNSLNQVALFKPALSNSSEELEFTFPDIVLQTLNYFASNRNISFNINTIVEDILKEDCGITTDLSISFLRCENDDFVNLKISNR